MSSTLKLLLALMLFAASAIAAAAQNGPFMLRGTVSSGGGLQRIAIAGAAVTIYQAQAGGAQALATGTSDSNGNFSLSLQLNGNGDVLYAIARKGTSIELMTVIGTAVPAGITINEMTTVAAAYAMAQVFQNGYIPYKPLVLAVAAGMAENLVSATTGMSSTVMQTAPNANQTNAWRSLGTLANILAACVRKPGHACTQLFGLTVVPRAAPPTTLSAMVNLARNPAMNVRPLFALGEVEKVYEPNLVAAIHGPDASDQLMRLDAFTLAIKFNATGRVDGQGKELCPFAGTGNIVFDANNGYVWITNNVIQGTPYSTNCFVVLKPNGQPADGAANTPNSPIFGGGTLGQGFGISFDKDGNVWAGNFGWGRVNPTDSSGAPGGSVSKFTSTGVPLSPPASGNFTGGYTSSLFQAQGTVSDKQGNIWIASYGNNRVQVFPNGNPDSNFPFYFDRSLLNPFDIRLDNDGSAWVSYQGTPAVSKFKLGANGLLLQFTVPITLVGTGQVEPKGLGVDSKGNAWLAAGGRQNNVYAIDKNGNLLGAFTGGGIVGPWGLQVSSDDTVWVANFAGDTQFDVKYGVSRLCGATTSNCPPGLKLGDPISPSTGYTLPSGGDEVTLHDGTPLLYPIAIKSYKPLMRMTAVNADMAGNLWATNNWKPPGLYDLTTNPGGDGMVVFVGLASPVLPVYYSAPKTSPFSTP
jgi:hypothetical protein